MFGLLMILLLAGLPSLARAEDEPDPFREGMKRMERAMQRMDHRAFRKLFDRDSGFGPWSASPATPSGGRLGVTVATPDPALVDQLNLPADSGLLIVDIRPGSAAEKAGLKKHDILLEWNGKSVPSQPARFAKTVAAASAGDSIDVVVLRKARKEAIKGLKLPAKAEVARFDPFTWDEWVGLTDAPRHSVTTSVTRTDDQFTATRKQGDLALTVKGKVDAGDVKVESVTVQDGGAKKTYDSLDAVPEAHRKSASDLARMAADGKSR